MLEVALVDGSWLGFDANRTWIRSPVSRSVRDISWAPTWWVLDFLVQEKVGGLAHGASEWHSYRERLESRTHKPFGLLRAPLGQAEVIAALQRQLSSSSIEHVAAADGLSTGILTKDGQGRLRHRFTVGPPQAGPQVQCTELTLHECSSQVNAAAIVALATTMLLGSSEGKSRQRMFVEALNSHQVEVTGRLAYDACEARLITDHLLVQEVDLNNQGGRWITTAALPPHLLRRSPFVINF